MSESNAPNLMRERLVESLEKADMNLNQLTKAAGLSTGTLYAFVAGRTRSMNTETIEKICPVLGITPSWLISGEDNTPEEKPQAVLVSGYVQAGLWQTAEQWSFDDKYVVQAPLPVDLPGRPIGLEVRGESMNAKFPPGTSLICATPAQLRQPPQTGHYVIVQRRRGGDVEATVKELEITHDGDALLLARSDDPEFEEPIRLPNFFQSGLKQSQDDEEIEITHIVIYAIVKMGSFRT
ncbi:MAG: hypothetical protein Alpg2KO_14370 [Alphaproteobacteria bacterium]